MRLHRFRIAVAAVLALSAGTAAAGAERPEEIKAAFVYNFVRFTAWPPRAFSSPDAPVRICVMESDPLEPALRTVDGKQAGGRTIEVARLDAAPLAHCHVRVLHGGDALWAGRPEDAVLTVSDAPDFARRGGAIGLVQVGRQIRFEVNATSLEQAGLDVSSKLLRLAIGVVR